ncbi:hypothetical protein RRG08_027792 [Elysia crispata]|uniref:Uncharacterized protein n=1 Tax=Elysia crispata TaxID=231223 RepID=A0AAE0Z9D9_9GAST|nr:hypothetical protein RRG08_027792 [Elysia crispata]
MEVAVINLAPQPLDSDLTCHSRSLIKLLPRAKTGKPEHRVTVDVIQQRISLSDETCLRLSVIKIKAVLARRQMIGVKLSSDWTWMIR